MKIEWQAEDVNGGRIVGNPERGERWIIGFNGAENFCLVNLADGQVSSPMTAVALATILNESRTMPVEFFEDRSFQRKGGFARAAKLTPEQRSTMAANAANARWSKGP